jgi:GMP synthase-like glutamine amidotransferase
MEQTMGSLYYIQHVPFEPPGMILDWAAEQHVDRKGIHIYQGERLPAAADGDVVVVMGGPMGVRDEDDHPWLRREKAFILDVIQRQVPIIGVCLGAQLIAAVLGAKVVRCPYRERGFSPVQLTREAARSPLFENLPTTFSPLHWHNDTFTIPDGGVRLAGNDACMNQAFLGPGRVLALQFHLEATPDLAYAWLKDSGAGEFSNPGVDENRYVQDIDGLIASAMRQTPENRAILYALLDRFVFPES